MDTVPKFGKVIGIETPDPFNGIRFCGNGIGEDIVRAFAGTIVVGIIRIKNIVIAPKISL